MGTPWCPRAVGGGAPVLVDGGQVREDGLGDVAKHGDLLW
jgi:hypothetical protein